MSIVGYWRSYERSSIYSLQDSFKITSSTLDNNSRCNPRTWSHFAPKTQHPWPQWRNSPEPLSTAKFSAPTTHSPDWKSGRQVFELLTPRQQQHSSLQIAFVSIAGDDGDMINDDGCEDDKACGLFNCLQSDRLKFDMRIPYRKAPTFTYPACGMALRRKNRRVSTSASFNEFVTVRIARVLENIFKLRIKHGITFV